MFGLFDDLGLVHPEYEKVVYVEPCKPWVVYTDNYAHCGEGKLLVKDGIFPQDVDSCYASEYIPDFPGLSFRYFVIAGQGAWFEHWSTDDWKSNCGDGDLGPLRDGILNKEEIEEACKKVGNAVFAIDFVAKKTEEGIYLGAIDFNTAPRLQGTPAHQILLDKFGSNQKIAEAISDWAAKYGVYDNNELHF
jgi:hypothetical protein